MFKKDSNYQHEKLKQELEKEKQKKKPSTKNNYEEGLEEIEEIAKEFFNEVDDTETTLEEEKTEEGGTIGSDLDDIEVNDDDSVDDDFPDDWDFITYYVKTLDEMTNADELFKEVCAIVLLGIIVGPQWFYVNAELPHHIRLKAQRLFINLSGCLVGLSRFAHKSECARKITFNLFILPYLERMEFKVPKNEKEKEQGYDAYTKMINPLIPGKLTTSALVKFGSERYDEKRDYTPLIQLDTEFTSMVEECEGGKYNKGYFPTLSELIDGESHYKGTSTEGGKDVINPYCSVLLCGQPHLPQLYKSNVWSQGFPNRFIYAVDLFGVRFPYDGDRKKKFRMGYPYKRIEIIRRWLSELLDTVGQRIFAVKPDTPASKRLEGFYDQCFDEAKNGHIHQFHVGYLGALPNIAIKLACLQHLSRMSLKDLQKENELSKIDKKSIGDPPPTYYYLNEEDVRSGISKARVFYDEFKKFVNLVYNRAYSKAVVTLDSLYKRVHETLVQLESDDPSRVDASRVSQRTKMDKNDIKKALIWLVESDLVEITNNKKAGGYGAKYRVTMKYE